MSEEITQNLPNDGMGLILARLDSIDTRLNTIDTRLDNLEEKVEARFYDTKPIWERALNEILETRAQVVKVEERLDKVEGRLGRVENEVKDMRRMFHRMFADLVRVQDDLAERLDKFEGSEKPS